MNFIVKQPLLVPESDHHILSINPSSLFLSSHSVTIASSQGRDGGETESEREQGNGGMRETERVREHGNWRNREG